MANNENYTIRVRRGTTNDWAVYNPVLGAGELGYDTTVRRLKVGDGLNVWSNLDFATGNSFDVARDAGFVGTLSEWLEDIRGEDGIDGDDGDPGPPVNLTIGAVKVADEAAVRVKGTSPTQQLEFDLPRSTEPSIVPGPPNELGIGTVGATTGNPSASISGSFPNQKLNLTLKTGPQGIPGIKGDTGTVENVTVDDLTDASAVGKTVVKAADAAAVRSAIGAGTTSASNGTSTELNTGTGTTNRIWAPKTLVDWVNSKISNFITSVASTDITDAGTVGRNVLTASSAANARSALSINDSVTYQDGTAAGLNAGVETYSRFWSAKVLTDWLTAKLGPYLTTVSSATITDATTVGKSLLTASSTTTGRTALGLSTGATTAAGSASVLNTGTSTTNYVWTPKILADYVKAATGALDGKYKPLPGLVDNLIAPVIISHRGGVTVYPEHSMEGYEASARDGFLPEADIQFLSDSTPVCIHDSTVDRTMTGVTGAVNTLTRKQFVNARIKPVISGGKDAQPVLFEEFLDRFGGRICLVAEVKSTATAGEVNAVIDMVKDRGLQRSILLQSFSFSVCSTIAAAGIEVTYLVSSTAPAQSPATMLAAGVKYLSPSTGMASGTITTYVSGGIKVIPYTIKHKYQADALPANIFGYFSDDPWENSGRMPKLSAPGWKSGGSWPGMRVIREYYTGPGAKESEYNSASIKLSGGNLISMKDTNMSDIERTSLISIDMDHMTGPIDRTKTNVFVIKMRFSGDYSGSTNGGMHLLRITDPSQTYVDIGMPGQYGYTFAMRRSGDLDAWKYMPNTNAESIVSTPTPAPSFTFTDFTSPDVTLIVRITPTDITMSCPETGMTGTVADSIAGPFRFYLRQTGTDITFTDVTHTTY